jgi:hypothetical protein
MIGVDPEYFLSLDRLQYKNKFRLTYGGITRVNIDEPCYKAKKNGGVLPIKSFSIFVLVVSTP